MSDLILHHYPMSPFAEKTRLILGFKQLAWRSVLIPPVMPKPDVIALTGGYRKTPVLQIGADIYCDTALIARVLEARKPTPTLYPVDAPLAVPLAQWADSSLFQVAVVWAMQPAGAQAILAGIPPEQIKVFGADRAAMRANAPRPGLADGAAQLRNHLSAIAAQLSRHGPWLFGAAPSIADFSVAHCLWFIRRASPVAALLDEYPAIGPWLDRVLAIGHHAHTEMSSTQAIAVGAAAAGHAPAAVASGQGFEPGETVTVAATDYGTDPVVGTLVGLSDDEAVVRRVDPRAGTVHVHFPRFGFQIRKGAPA
ncbi:MAG: glutathione S-transferase family protein [Xanthobacteraceae bacterium]|nr:glutathione S-transferase family protein [Xanthobacteraceae bacterium]